MAPDEALVGTIHPQTAQRVAIVLEPQSHPELGAIYIDDNLFAIGRGEPPFDGYAPSIVADLSRRHARIFIEAGDAYLADLGSKNGTTVNGIPVRQTIMRLNNGDELGLAGVLSYRVRLQTVDAGPAPPARLASLSLQPERADLGLEPIVITRFPFLISKVDDSFARYRDAHPHQVAYLSRRHAHIFLKGGLPYVEDLGSTNGSFIGAVRLDEHAHELKEGDVLAFGGHHFVYRVSLQWEQAAPDPTVTRVALPPAVSEDDKTTFVAAPGSFLDIFCIDQGARTEDEVNPAQVVGEGGPDAAHKRARGKFALLAAGLLDALGAAGDASQARLRPWLAGLAALVVLVPLVLYRAGAPERELKSLVDSGEYANAALLANDLLASDPSNAELRALGTQALLKAGLPPWMASIKSRRFDQAARELARMRQLGSSNPDAQALVAEIAWVGALEQFVAGRGGADAPLRGAADQARIRQIIKQWLDEQQTHQRAFATISSYVPAFRDTYAQALSDLRKLALVGGTVGDEA
jgi:pSer/pThr/pTyr-binding forkhead associated (FHA) protein